MPQPNPGTADEPDEEPLTPDDVLEMRPDHTDDPVTSPEEMMSVFEEILTPRTRAAILDVLVYARGEALTVSQMADENPRVSASSFDRHKDDLLDFGLMVEAGKIGNAMTYALNTDHPGAQVLAMLDNVMLWGETPMMLGKQFINETGSPGRD